MGNPAYPPLIIFKVLLLQRWHDLSNQGMGDALADRISFRRLAGMSLDYATPDSTTISSFRNYLLDNGLDLKLYNMLGEQPENHGLIVKQVTILYTSIITSSWQLGKSQIVEEGHWSEGEELEIDLITT